MPKILEPKVISLDTETTGIDFHHGAKPYFVTICEDGSEEPLFWEWEVNPKTREPIVPAKDLKAIESLVQSASLVVLQNAKFDVAALRTIHPKLAENWPWENTFDTLLAGHILASNQPKDLTALATYYLGVDIQPFEDLYREVTMRARTLARNSEKDSRFTGWRIAKDGDPSMPSIKEKSWKVDGWLLKEIRRRYPELGEPSWDTALANYGNADSVVTLSLYPVMIKLIRERGLEKIFRESLKILPSIYNMENIGVTLSRTRHKEQLENYRTQAEKLGVTCVGIANCMGFELVLPKGASNGSLLKFIDEGLGAEKFEDRVKTPTGKTGLDKEAIWDLTERFPKGTNPRIFLDNFRDRKSLMTAISYLESYERFWIPVEGHEDHCVLFPSVNPTGTDTLRCSSENPNEQNISKKEGFNLRYVFGPTDDEEWWSADAENIELRLPAYESGERLLIDLFEKPNEAPYFGSMHLLNMSTVYADIWERELKNHGLDKVGAVCKKLPEYGFTKNGGFAVQYGAVLKANGWGTADRAFGRQHSHAKLNQRFTKKELLNRRCIEQANRLGYVETIPDRNVDPCRGYPLRCRRMDNGGVLPTVPLNYHVQGSAMWWMRKAMVRCENYLRELRNKGIMAWIIMQVHDQLVFRFPRGTGKKPWKTNLPYVQELCRLMELGGHSDYGIPTPVALEYHPENWADGVPIKWKTV